jgi:hypothetical protein
VEPTPTHLPRHGHYHAQVLDDGDVMITPCSTKHDSKHDGRSIKACGTGAWSNAIFPRISEPRKLSEVEGVTFCFRCKSWRCVHCRPFIFRRDFARVCTALESRPRWLFVVTTFSPSSWQSGKTSCWRNAWRANQRLRQRLARAVRGKVEYVCTMEQHKSGWPHSNWAIRFDLLDQVEEEDLAEFASKVERLVKDTAPSVGLGHSVYCEVLQGKERASAYFSKLAGEKDTPGAQDAAGEISKTSQVPMDAPIGTRRIRASRGLLPPLRRGDRGLGVAIIKAPLEAINPSKAPMGSAIDSLSAAITLTQGKPGQEPGAPPVWSGGAGGSAPATAAVRGGSDGKEQFTASASRGSDALAAGNPVKNQEVGEKSRREEWWRIAQVTRAAMESQGIPEQVIRTELRALKESWDYVELTSAGRFRGRASKSP